MTKKMVLMFLILNGAINGFLPNQVTAASSDNGTCSGNNHPRTNLDRVRGLIIPEARVSLMEIEACDLALAVEAYNIAARRVETNRSQGQISQFNIDAIESLKRLAINSVVKVEARKALLQLATFDNSYKTSDPKTTDLMASMKIKLLALGYFLEKIKFGKPANIPGYTVKSGKGKADRSIEGGEINVKYIDKLLDAISKNDGNIKVRGKITEVKAGITSTSVDKGINDINVLKTNPRGD